jgi:D-specific alpha-keto acid dehydrogenase
VTCALGITVYGCERDEADLFKELAPRFGVVPTTTRAAVSETSIGSASGTRCISVGHKSEVSEPMLLALKAIGVEYISTRSIGVNHIDVDAAARIGITVENVVYGPDGVADYTVMLILMAIRNAKGIVGGVAHYDFRLVGVRGNELRDMTVGVVGVGNIGNAVINRLRGFRCRVLASNNRQAAAAGAELVSLDELLLESDIVTLHVPLNADTHHLIGRRQLDAMKPGAFIVNTGRGALVDTDALIASLETGALGGAALDVLEGEEGLFYFDCTQRPVENRFLCRLLAMPNVIITPHTAYYTRRALNDTVAETLTRCREFERSRRSA